MLRRGNYYLVCYESCLIPAQQALVRLMPTFSAHTGQAPEHIVRVDAALDTQQARIIIAPENLREAGVVGVSLPESVRASAEQKCGNL
jgi:hypothetical protein